MREFSFSKPTSPANAGAQIEPANLGEIVRIGEREHSSLRLDLGPGIRRGGRKEK
jgi:hypothetical protein